MNDFGLPKRWAIKITKENNDIVANYFSVVSTKYFSGFVGSYLGSINSNDQPVEIGANASFARINIGSDFTEITTEQFKKYVLGIEIDTKNEIITEDLDYLKDFLTKLNIK